MVAAPTHEQRMAYVNDRLKAIGKGRVQKAQIVAREGSPDLISGALLIAVSLRETGGRNVLGDYPKGSRDRRRARARGAFQIHDAYHIEWLRTVRGCFAAAWIAEATRINWIPVPGTNAAMPGFCPTWIDGCRYTAQILNDYVDQAEDIATPEAQLAVALAAFNCGFDAALQGHMAFDVDRATTGGDYSADVLLRASEVREWLGDHPNWKA
jgi:hypothetical protein